ncbi:MAG: hypothetical protein V1726_08290 [Methanobacteriota archaeon]
MKKHQAVLLLLSLVLVLFMNGCISQNSSDDSLDDVSLPSRASKIPVNASKQNPDQDLYPPILHAQGYNEPFPLPTPVNTAGAEDSSFILPDGNTLYFFFTPDVKVPAEQQLFDGVTGIYVTKKYDEIWSEPERVVLQDPGKLALDGCEFVQDNIIWFCSAREGYTGVRWFTAQYENGQWSDWENADFDPAYDVGELHFSTNGSELYYHSQRAGGIGGLDIWVSQYVNNSWQEPINVEAVNTPENEGWPCLTQDGKELWFTRWYQGSPAIYRSQHINDTWLTPELILSQFAGEPSVDNDGNIYFTHHFYQDNEMIEADIYFVQKKK